MHSWVRLTDYPLTAEVFVDETTGDLRGCYDYMVRPVGPDGEEGPAATLRYVALNNVPPEVQDPEHCFSSGAFDIDTKLPISASDERDRINNIERGPKEPDENPDPPVLIDSNGSLSNARRDHGNDPSDYWGLYAFVEWEQNLESDLAGYHVEMASSPNGPWQRVTRDPIAWWETRYDARLWVNDFGNWIYDGYQPYIGPECVVFQVIAVDENGNESLPSDVVEIPPAEESAVTCSAGATPTIQAPQNLTADFGPNPPCTTLLTWDQVPDVEKYRIYVTNPGVWGFSFYVSQEVPNEPPYCDGLTCTVEDNNAYGCPFSDPQNCATCTLRAFFVTAVEPSGTTELGRESPRSKTVFWNPNSWDDVPGYVYLDSKEPEWESVAAATAPAPEPLSVTWCEGESQIQAGRLECSYESGHPAYETSLETHWEITSSKLYRAPLLTLGQAFPSFDIYDLHVDHLGSTRVVTDATGAMYSTHDFFPFGEEIAPVFDYNTKMFTGHERDKETGLDYMFARYYGGTLGRFLSPDPITSAKPQAPQSWNRYAYVLNNPLGYLDPTGLYTISCGEGVSDCDAAKKAFEDSVEKGRNSKDKERSRAAEAYGEQGEENGVEVVLTTELAANVGGETSYANDTGYTFNEADKTFQAATLVKIDASLSGRQLEDVALHEGSHAADRSEFVSSLIGGSDGSLSADQSLNITRRESEERAYGGINRFGPRRIQRTLSREPYKSRDLSKPIYPHLAGVKNRD